ncbi:NAD(P)-binding protein [Neolentinus lepideus HHB14362 ss-1]|uniref:NAD(P)-binding protein n=1 Tax=Neolentinus lepideus HHB14362 ss-1 TaxID=1314782 RepID=A0A165WAH8_9AGAM|nr:NAD(P)-binding protein [Neolentinus lepideus HHB14362 ss-1]
MSNQKHNSLLKQFQKGYRQPVQDQPGAPGLQEKLDPQPLDDVTADGKPYKAANKLEGKAALITGADSGIGRAIAILYALEGADLTLTYLPQEEKEVKDVEQRIQAKTRGKTKVVTIAADVRKESVCQDVIKQHMSAHGRLDVLVLNHGTQETNTELPTLPTEQWHNTFDTNLHSFFYFCKAALPNMGPGSSVIFNASINFAVGHPELIDYTATKGAMIALARALSNQVAGDGIRINAVAPGPIWTPLIPATMTKKSKESFGQSVPMGRAGQPIEVATSFVFLASADSSYISGQVFHVNGGVVIN